MKNLLPVFMVFLTLNAYAQEKTGIKGIVRDEFDQPVKNAIVSVVGSNTGTQTDNNGAYFLELLPDITFTIRFFMLGYEAEELTVELDAGEQREINKAFTRKTITITDVSVGADEERRSSITRIDPKLLSSLPNTSGSFESILKTLPGVSSNNELSSQYSVRGGNFDENLVYVNDIEIYRPFLIRSGQQEGLSFINSDMVSSVKFSAGGFDAKYGDKLSSVLDISYKKPLAFGATAAVSLLGANLNIEGATPNHRATVLFGVRQKSNQYVLSSLETKGEYAPSFTDLQTYLTYDVSTRFELAFLGNYSQNKYTLAPEDRETTFGTFGNVLRLRVFFEGQEVDRYSSAMGGLMGTYTVHDNLRLKFITSRFEISENETFDIQGQYIFDEIETDFGKENFGEVRANLGIGTYLNHARNYLKASISNYEHKGFWNLDRNLLQWGVKFQQEHISDKLSEWTLIDSAGYAVPDIADEIVLQDVVKAKISLSSNRYSSYVQNTFSLSDTADFVFTLGARASYWDFNEQFQASPRGTLSYKPDWKRDIVFRASTGFYYQPPFYRELRDINGSLNSNAKAQRSVHYVLAGDYVFKAFGGRTFKFVSEAYYKDFKNLIPYEVDNVRIRYYANTTSKGYAAGMDFKVNGEFVKDLESWFSLSMLKTEEDIDGDFYFLRDENDSIIGRVEPGYIPRPTDQRLNFAIFFQDKLLKDPTYKVHLNLVYGGRLPIGPPDFARYKDTLRIPPYRRVDIGFSKEILGRRSGLKPESRLKHIRSVTFYAEVFNLLKIANTISYLWVRDVNDNLFAVPNYLTSRQLNVKVIIKI